MFDNIFPIFPVTDRDWFWMYGSRKFRFLDIGDGKVAITARDGRKLTLPAEAFAQFLDEAAERLFFQAAERVKRA